MLSAIKDDIASKAANHDQLIADCVSALEYERFRNETQKVVDNLGQKVSDFDLARKQISTDLTYMRQIFNEKVDVKELRVIEQRIEMCAPWDAVRQIYKELSGYIKRENFE